MNHSGTDTNGRFKPAAIYLVGHGPLREPRLIELQHLRIHRHIQLLATHQQERIIIGETFVDINFPRNDDSGSLPALQRLLDKIRDDTYTTVLVDIDEQGRSHTAPLAILNTLRQSNARIINVLDEDDLIDRVTRERFAVSRSEVILGDNDDFIAFFPTLAGHIVVAALEDAEGEVASGQRLHILCSEKPYPRSELPLLSSLKSIELSRRRRKLEQELAARRQSSDVLLRLSPQDEGVPLDYLQFATPRTPEQLEWAETRLTEDLGFRKESEGRFLSLPSLARPNTKSVGVSA